MKFCVKFDGFTYRQFLIIHTFFIISYLYSFRYSGFPQKMTYFLYVLNNSDLQLYSQKEYDILESKEKRVSHEKGNYMDMKPVRFLHFSDPHLRCNYEGTRIMRLYHRTKITLTEQFLLAVRHMQSQCDFEKLDFCLISGDLVHEGTAEDYAYVHQIFQQSFPRIPCYVALGNHDNDTFWQGYLNKQNNGSYDYEVYHKESGLRIIGLDSRGGAYGTGMLTDAQLLFLQSRLQKKASGTLLLMHHTPHTSNQVPYLQYQMQTAQPLAAILADSDVIGIFTGHTHKRFVSYLGKIPCYTAESICFGIESTETHMTWHNGTGYHLCEFDGAKLHVTHVPILPDTVVEDTISCAELFSE